MRVGNILVVIIDVHACLSLTHGECVFWIWLFIKKFVLNILHHEMFLCFAGITHSIGALVRWNLFEVEGA